MENTINSSPKSGQEKPSSWWDSILSTSRTKIALVTLFVSTLGWGIIQAQTTSWEKSIKMEQITTISNPQEDMANLLKKYNVPSVDDIWEMSFNDMAKMRYDLTVLLGKNTTWAYHLDPHLVAVRDELIKNISVLLITEQERLTFKKDANEVIGRGITLDKAEKKLSENEKKLSENEKKLSENEKIARQFGIIK